MSTPRRDFLGWLGASALAGSAGLPGPLGAAEATDAGTGAGANTTARWDMSWTSRVTGRYRAVFDAPEVSDGAGVFRALLWRDQHREVYGTAAADLSAVLVVRHAAIPLVMDDEYWARFAIGERAKLKDPATKAWALRNPLLRPMDGMPPAFAEYSLPHLLATGGVVLACDLALRSAVADFARGDKLPPDEARAAALRHVVPGVVLQPSGIFAALRAQEIGCSYVMAS